MGQSAKGRGTWVEAWRKPTEAFSRLLPVESHRMRWVPLTTYRDTTCGMSTREATEDSVPGFLLGDGPTDTLCPAHTKLSDLQRESSCSDRLGKWGPLTALFLSMQRTFTIQVPRGQQEVFSNTAASGLLVHYFLHTNIIKIFIGYNKYILQYYLSALVTT